MLATNISQFPLEICCIKRNPDAEHMEEKEYFSIQEIRDLDENLIKFIEVSFPNYYHDKYRFRVKMAEDAL